MENSGKINIPLSTLRHEDIIGGERVQFYAFLTLVVVSDKRQTPFALLPGEVSRIEG